MTFRVACFVHPDKYKHSKSWNPVKLEGQLVRSRSALIKYSISILLKVPEGQGQQRRASDNIDDPVLSDGLISGSPVNPEEQLVKSSSALIKYTISILLKVPIDPGRSGMSSDHFSHPSVSLNREVAWQDEFLRCWSVGWRFEIHLEP